MSLTVLFKRYKQSPCLLGVHQYSFIHYQVPRTYKQQDNFLFPNHGILEA